MIVKIAKPVMCLRTDRNIFAFMARKSKNIQGSRFKMATRII